MDENVLLSCGNVLKYDVEQLKFDCHRDIVCCGNVLKYDVEQPSLRILMSFFMLWKRLEIRRGTALLLFDEKLIWLWKRLEIRRGTAAVS